MGKKGKDKEPELEITEEMLRHFFRLRELGLRHRHNLQILEYLEKRRKR